jgi:hypothetical protein
MHGSTPTFIATFASGIAKSSNGKSQNASDRMHATECTKPHARDRMIDGVLKALALTALASIAIGAVRWLVRRPTALLVVLMILGASTLLMH